MSHFTVLVIGDNAGEHLAPYHEFESTDTDNEYVQCVDRTAEARKTYEAEMSEIVTDPEGKTYSAYDDRFYPQDRKDLFGKKPERVIPEGWVCSTVPTKSIESFAQWVEEHYDLKQINKLDTPDLAKNHKYGWVRVDEHGEVMEAIDRTNPNRKWDWYQLGGRWTGYFKLKPNHIGSVGEPGIGATSAEPGTADAALKGAIDFEAMRDAAATKAHVRYTKFFALLGDLPYPKTWDEMREKYPEIAVASAKYHEQPAIIAMKDDNEFRWTADVAAEFACSREEYVHRAKSAALSTFAVIKDGKWYQKGDMGWWGIVRDPLEQGAWDNVFNELLNSVSDDTLLSIYDCHI